MTWHILVSLREGWRGSEIRAERERDGGKERTLSNREGQRGREEGK